MSCRHQSIVILLCALVLQGCGSSSATDGSEPTNLPEDDSGQPSGDGDGSQSGDGVTPPVTHLPGEDVVPIVAVGPQGDSHLTANGRVYPLDSALGDIWGPAADHFNVNFTVSNGRYRLESAEIDGSLYELLVPAAASAIFHAELYSPGEQFSLMTYSHSPFGDGSGVLAGNAFFDDAYVGVDEDLSGDVEDDEKRAVIGGTVDFTGVLPNIELRFSVTLEDGQLVEGHYTGLFDFTSR